MLKAYANQAISAAAATPKNVLATFTINNPTTYSQTVSGVENKFTRLRDQSSSKKPIAKSR